MGASATTATAVYKSFRVLVVDDNKGDTSLTTRQLGAAWPFEHDLTVDWAADGAEAIGKLRQEHFTLLILDWHRPGMGGADILRHVRQSGVRIPVVVMSGVERAAIDTDLDAHAAAYLHKNELNHVTFHTVIATALHLLAACRRHEPGNCPAAAVVD